MTRLDVWLVENHIFFSRQAAKRAIRAGLVTVDGVPGKPSMDVNSGQQITVSPKATNRPRGYEKLRAIDESVNWQLVRSHIHALDIGSSSGGFLLYLAEHNVYVTGIEVSMVHANRLLEIKQQYPNVSIIIGDAFSLDPSHIAPPESIDLLLVDVTTDPEGTLHLISRYSPVLKKSGWLLAAFKKQFSSSLSSHMSEVLTSLGYETVLSTALSRFRKEFHLLATKR